MSKSELKNEHQEFINQYFLLNMNGTHAYKATYGEKLSDNVAAASASQLLRKPKVAAEITRRLQEKMMSVDEILARLAEQAANAHTIFIGTDGTVDLKALKKAGLMHLVKGTKHNSKGKLIVEFYDAQKAKELIGKYHAIWANRVIVEHTWRDDIYPLIKDGRLTYQAAVSDFCESLAQELFAKAGVDYE